MNDLNAIIQRYESLKRQQDFWIPTYEVLAQYILMRKIYFKNQVQPGPFIYNLNYDGTAINAVRVMAASIFGQVWPSASESFEFQPEIAQEDTIYGDEDSFNFAKDVNGVMSTQLSNPSSGFLTAWLEALTDLIIFGTAFVYVIATGDLSQPLRFQALDAKSIVVDEDDTGKINTAFITHRLTVASVVSRYGLQNCSSQVQQKYKDTKNHSERVVVLQAIMPNISRAPGKRGKDNMAWKSVHIDITHGRHELERGGFNEMPIIGMRFYKNPGEVLGRSPAMDAISDIKELNKNAELFTKAGEFALNPPKLVYKEHILGGQPVWKSGAWIMAHTAGRMGSDRPPIEALHIVKNPAWAGERIKALQEQVQNHFLIDRLTDLNNRSRQTMGEAVIRNNLREHITGPVLSRILTEGLQPILDRAFNILLEAGFFGVVRGSIEDLHMRVNGIQPKYLSESFINARMSGVKGYKIRFISPAARAQYHEQLAGMQQLRQSLMEIAQLGKPEVLDLIDWDEWTRLEHFVSGASLKVLNSSEKVAQIRQMAAQMQAQAQQMAQAQQEAEILKSAGKGIADLGGSGVAA